VKVAKPIIAAKHAAGPMGRQWSSKVFVRGWYQKYDRCIDLFGSAQHTYQCKQTTSASFSRTNETHASFDDCCRTDQRHPCTLSRRGKGDDLALSAGESRQSAHDHRWRIRSSRPFEPW